MRKRLRRRRICVNLSRTRSNEFTREEARQPDQDSTEPVEFELKFQLGTASKSVQPSNRYRKFDLFVAAAEQISKREWTARLSHCGWTPNLLIEIGGTEHCALNRAPYQAFSSVRSGSGIRSRTFCFSPQQAYGPCAPRFILLFPPLIKRLSTLIDLRFKSLQRCSLIGAAIATN